MCGVLSKKSRPQIRKELLYQNDMIPYLICLVNNSFNVLDEVIKDYLFSFTATRVIARSCVHTMKPIVLSSQFFPLYYT